MVFVPGVEEFIKLKDTPSSYTGNAGKFVRVNSLEDALEFADAGGGGIPYRIVAASDASAESKAKAHYVCSGANDQNTIEQAINDLPATGGIIFLTEGNYSFDAYKEIYSDNKSIAIIGSGIDNTVLNSSGSYIFRPHAKSFFMTGLTSNLYTFSITGTNLSYVRIVGCYFNGGYAGIQLIGSSTVSKFCIIENNIFSGGSSGCINSVCYPGIDIIRNNKITGSINYSFSSSSNYTDKLVIDGNVFTSGGTSVNLTHVIETVIVNNIFSGGNITAGVGNTSLYVFSNKGIGSINFDAFTTQVLGSVL